MKVYKDDKEIKLKQALSELGIDNESILAELDEDGLIQIEKTWKEHLYVFIPE